MKKYKVDCIRETGKQFYGEEPHEYNRFIPYDGSVEAENAVEAIELLKQYIIDNSDNASDIGE